MDCDNSRGQVIVETLVTFLILSGLFLFCLQVYQNFHQEFSRGVFP